MKRNKNKDKKRFDKSGLDTRYQEAVNAITTEAWIGRMGEEAAELAAAVSKYIRVINKTFPCSMSDEDAQRDMIGELIDVENAIAAYKSRIMDAPLFSTMYCIIKRSKMKKLIGQVEKAKSRNNKRVDMGNFIDKSFAHRVIWEDMNKNVEKRLHDPLVFFLLDMEKRLVSRVQVVINGEGIIRDELYLTLEMDRAGIAIGAIGDAYTPDVAERFTSMFNLIYNHYKEMWELALDIKPPRPSELPGEMSSGRDMIFTGDQNPYRDAVAEDLDTD